MNSVGLVTSMDRALGAVHDGDTVYLGGAVLDRKPMAFVRALAVSGVEALDVMSFAGSLGIDVLVGAGCVRSVASGYVGLGAHGRAPAFTAAVTAGTIIDSEYSEWTMVGGLRAAAMGVPFLPTTAAMGSDVAAIRGLRPVADPYTGSEYLAVPALRPDVTVLHAWRATAAGVVQTPWPPDHLFDVDVVAARAAATVVVTVEEVVDDAEAAARPEWTILLPVDVDHIVPAPRGAWPTSARPLYEADHDAVAVYRDSGSIDALVEAA